MQKSVLVVHAHPEPTSLTHTMAETAKAELAAAGYGVLESDLYAMNWKAVYDAQDFSERADPSRLSFIAESAAAYAKGTLTADVVAEQEKLKEADAVVILFPLWWFSFPAILKGWVERVFAFGLAYGYKGQGNQFRYGDGGFAGKRALLGVMAGGSAVDYGARGVNGPLEQLLFPVTHGMLFYSGMEVLPTFAVHSSMAITEAGVEEAKRAFSKRLSGLFTDAPIPFRFQNKGDYADHHQLADSVAPGLTGILAHVETPDILL